MYHYWLILQAKKLHVTHSIVSQTVKSKQIISCEHSLKILLTFICENIVPVVVKFQYYCFSSWPKGFNLGTYTSYIFDNEK